MDIDTTEGLLVSADGENFSQDVGLEDIKNAIQNKTGFELGNLRNDAITLKHIDQKVSFDEDGNLEFVKDALVDIADSDHKNHKMISADSKDYVAFDLWFKAITTGKEHRQYTLKMNGSGCYVDAEDKEVELQNRLQTQTDSYQSGDVITVNPKNAMRVGVTYVDNGENKLNVYEPNEGLGSSAIEGSTEATHNKNQNAMYTYYNNTHPLSAFTKAAEDGEGYKTNRDFSLGECGTFMYSEQEKDYNVIRVTVYVWLEGWDADYFAGVPATNVRIKLGFILE